MQETELLKARKVSYPDVNTQKVTENSCFIKDMSLYQSDTYFQVKLVVGHYGHHIYFLTFTNKQLL